MTQGNIRRQIRQIVVEDRADILVMGRPVRSPGSNVFKGDEFDRSVSE